MKEKVSKPSSSELNPDMKLYFGEMSKVLRYQGYSLSLAGLNMGRSVMDMARELLLRSIDKLGALDDDISIWKDGGDSLFSETQRKVDSGEIEPKSKIPKKYKKLFQDIRTFYCFAEEKVKEKGENAFSYENGPIGVPVMLAIEMLDKVVDSNSAKKKWEAIKGDRDRVSEFFTLTKWQV